MIYKTDKFTIYFGDSNDAIHDEIDCVPSSAPLITHQKFELIAKKIGVEHLAFLNQTHSTDGMVVSHQIPAFDADGDYLITRRPHVGIGVITADCLPIIIYDQKNHAAASIHAGWRGTVARIVQKAVIKMQEEIGSRNEDLQMFFGPSGKSCCYQVTGEFLEHLKSFSYADSTIKKNNNALYFDVPQLNVLQLQEIGVDPAQISQEYNLCTICDHLFYSYRRQRVSAGRQMSIISLNY
jgi:YfiH family protein